MTNNYTRASVLALLICGAGSALAQQTFTFTGTRNSVDGLDAAGNVTDTGIPVSAAYSMGNIITLNGGTLTKVQATTWASEARIKLVNSDYPFDQILIQPSTLFAFTPPITLTAGTVLLSVGNSLIGKPIATTSTWTAQFYESANDGVAGLVDATWSDLSFTLSAFTPGDVILNSASPIASRDAAGTAGNDILTVAGPAAPVVLTTTGYIHNTTWTRNQALSQNNHARIRVSYSALPGLFMDYTPNISTSTTLSPIVTSAIVSATNTSLAGPIIPPGGTYSFEFYESVQNGTAGLPEATWTNMNLTIFKTIVALPTIAQNLTVPAGTEFRDFVRDADNQIVGVGTTASTFVMGNQALVFGQLERVSTSALATNQWIKLRNSSAPFSHVFVLPALDQIWGGALFQANISAVRSANTADGQTLVGLTIPAGSTWTAELFNNVFAENDGLAASKVNSLSIGLVAGPALVIPSAPTSIDLGTLNSFTKTTLMPAIPVATTQWYKIVLPEVSQANGKWLDMWTVPPTSNVNLSQDTELGIYLADGRLVADDDDNGVGAYSSLSIGNNSTTRPATVSGTLLPGLAFSGSDQDAIAAGTYYVAVGRFNMTFGLDQFNVVNTSTVAIVANTRLEMRTNAFAPQSINGTVTIGDLIPDEAGKVVAYELLDSASVVVKSGDVTLGLGGTFAINCDDVAAGTYTLTMKSSNTLKAGDEAVNLNGTPYTATLTLLSGDADGDNFIGLDDFNLLSNSFNLGVNQTGYAANADFDGDEFVGLDDFNILSNNFNIGGYGS